MGITWSLSAPLLVHVAKRAYVGERKELGSVERASKHLDVAEALLVGDVVHKQDSHRVAIMRRRDGLEPAPRPDPVCQHSANSTSQPQLPQLVSDALSATRA
eukprot:28619-Rhodomonas_salina.1